MKNVKLLFLLLIGLGVKTAHGQNHLISQYYLNSYMLNPSMAGVNGDLSILAAYRQDLIGFEEGPQTQMLSFEMPFKDEKFGIGGYLVNTTIGPQRRTGFQGSYAYHIRLRDDVNVSMGLGANLWNMSINFNDLLSDQFNNNDPVLLGESASATSFDASAGVTLSTANFYTGFSVQNLIQTDNKFGDDTGPVMQNARHLNWLTGFKIPIKDSVWDFEPSIFIKYAFGNSPQADLNARFIYKDFLWLAASYRARYTLVGAFGLKVKDMIDVGYSYDHHADPIAFFGGPSHEITLKYTLPREKPAVIDTSILVDTNNLYKDSGIVDIDTVPEVIEPVIDTTIAVVDTPSTIKGIDTLAVVETPEVDAEANYNKLIEDADKAFEEKDWEAAKSKYAAALKEKPLEDYPKVQLGQLDELIAAETEGGTEQIVDAGETEAERLAAEKKEAARIAAEKEQARLEEEKERVAQLAAEEAERKAEEARLAVEKAAADVNKTEIGGEEIDQYDESNPYNYVIVGSFGNFNNAQRLRDDMKKKGYDAEILEHKSRGFYRVSLHKTLDSTDAENNKSKLRKELNNPGVWVLEGKKYKKDATKLDNKESAEKDAAQKAPVVKRSVDVDYKEEKGERVELLNDENQYYHVIAGSFSSMDNAINLKKKYEAQGYPAKILLDTDKNLYRVALFSSLDAGEGRSELAKLQKSIDPSLWMIKK